MRAGLRTGILATAAITAAVALSVAVTLPPRAIAVAEPAPPTHLAGAYHIHTTRSDGTGTVDDVARAAARANLRFIVLTDHGDATRAPDPPAYRHGVLVIDAVEINTREGHVVALGLTDAAPYPLAGPSGDVIADIHRMGGVAVAAHPDSPRSELAWRGSLAGVDGFEWINIDSEWRDENTPALVGRALHSLLRGPEAIASLFARPTRSLQRWDTNVRARSLFGLAALDAHASIGWREQEEPRRSVALARPGYETLFRTLAQIAVVERELSGEAGADAAIVLEALRTGRSYSVVRAFAWPPVLEFAARQNAITVPPGGRLVEAAGEITFAARMPSTPGVRLELRRDGDVHTTGQGSLTTTERIVPGAYRIEAYLPGMSMPWVVSNPIVVDGEVVDAVAGRGRGRGRGSQEPPGTVAPRLVPLDASAWHIEHDPSSTGAIGTEAGRLVFDYALGAGPARGQYAALVHDDAGSEGIQSVRFAASAARPMRVSVQVRLPAGRGRLSQRWRTSVFVDETPRTFDLRLQDFEPADRPTARQPLVTPIDSLLFVIDTINARPESTGRVWLSDVALGVNRME